MQVVAGLGAEILQKLTMQVVAGLGAEALQKLTMQAVDLATYPKQKQQCQ